MAKIDNIYNAVDDFGLIASFEAAELGMSNAELVQQARMGKLVRVARGVYRMPVWPFQVQAPYAIVVKAAGEGACLYGESVVALLGLAPTDPTKMWVAVRKRTRRSIGSGTKIVLVKGIDPVTIEGVPCQPVADALVCAAASIGAERVRLAATEALRQGYITRDEERAIVEEFT